jgi:hypothetical protein
LLFRKGMWPSLLARATITSPVEQQWSVGETGRVGRQQEWVLVGSGSCQVRSTVNTVYTSRAAHTQAHPALLLSWAAIHTRDPAVAAITSSANNHLGINILHTSAIVVIMCHMGHIESSSVCTPGTT